MRSFALSRRSLLASVAATAIAAPAFAAGGAGDPIRKLAIYAAAQASDPQEYQAAQLLAQACERHADTPDTTAVVVKEEMVDCRERQRGSEPLPRARRSGKRQAPDVLARGAHAAPLLRRALTWRPRCHALTSAMENRQ